MKIIIKEAEIHEAQFISLLGRVTFNETFGHHFTELQELRDYLSTTFSVKKISNSLSKKDNIFWIAYVDDLPVGYAKLKLNSTTPFIQEDRICQLQKIYVLKDFLSLKIGFRLQEQMIEKAQNLHFDYIWLSVLKENQRALSFYQRTGYSVIGQHDFKIGSQVFDFVAMGKGLNEEC